jgi:hypothetical protein
MFSWGKFFFSLYWLSCLALIIAMAFSRVIAGFFSGRMYKTMKGTQWKKVAFMVTFFFDFSSKKKIQKLI